MSLLSFRQKVLIGDCNPVVYLMGEQGEGHPFFAYLSLPMEQLARLNRDMERGVLVHLAEYGKVVLQGRGEPTAEQKSYMERHYAFDHTDPFADDEEEAISACAA